MGSFCDDMEVLYDLAVGLASRANGSQVACVGKSLKCWDLLGQSKGAENAVITRAGNSLRLTLPSER